ncbi:hypothetical protein Q0F98_04110 [Paenibacillus amylolyticus]|nr:hypothetical protein Q0F98_04110 [Paenibacillus amylolyticus]
MLKQLKPYKVLQERRIEELKSDAYLLEHQKSGAKIVLLSNQDDNKVFSIGFRTPPEDDTGVAHIPRTLRALWVQEISGQGFFC